MSREFKVLSAAEYVAQGDPWAGRQQPKDAFREGFVHAIREMRRLRGMGFGRLDEVANMLESFAGGDLKGWSQEAGGAHNATAPQAWNGGTWAEIRENVFKRDGQRCARCDSTNELHIDHAQPVNGGGLPVLRNLQVLCKTCNLQKGAR